jgi:hypothetical protein
MDRSSKHAHFGTKMRPSPPAAPPGRAGAHWRFGRRHRPASGRGGADSPRRGAGEGSPPPPPARRPPAAGYPPSPGPRRPAEPALAGGPPWVRTTPPTGKRPWRRGGARGKGRPVGAAGRPGAVEVRPDGAVPGRSRPGPDVPSDVQGRLRPGPAAQSRGGRGPARRRRPGAADARPDGAVSSVGRSREDRRSGGVGGHLLPQRVNALGSHSSCCVQSLLLPACHEFPSHIGVTVL